MLPSLGWGRGWGWRRTGRGPSSSEGAHYQYTRLLLSGGVRSEIALLEGFLCLEELRLCLLQQRLHAASEDGPTTVRGRFGDRPLSGFYTEDVVERRGKRRPVADLLAERHQHEPENRERALPCLTQCVCLLYTSDAADDLLCVDLG